MMPTMSSGNHDTPTFRGTPISETGRNKTKPPRPPGQRCTCKCGCQTKLSIWNNEDELNTCSACHPNRLPPCQYNRDNPQELHREPQ